MKQIGKINKGQLSKSLSTLPIGKELSPRLPGGEISIYTGPLSNECKMWCIGLVKKAFPALPVDFYDVLIDRIEAHEFSNQRFIDAVNHVIDNCPYPTPTVHHFVSFDQRFKYFTYDQMLAKADEHGQEVWKSYKSLMLQENTKPVWVHVNDITKYNIQTNPAEG